VAGGAEGAALPASSGVAGGHAAPPDARSKGGEAGASRAPIHGE
jgi:hypothetical protein